MRNSCAEKSLPNSLRSGGRPTDQENMTTTKTIRAQKSRKADALLETIRQIETDLGTRRASPAVRARNVAHADALLATAIEILADLGEV